MSSDQDSGNEPGPPSPAPARWNPAVTVLMIVLGLPLLLPGVCSLLFASPGGGGGIVALGFLISFGGITMIVFGIRRLFTRSSVPERVVSESAKLILLLILLAILIVLGLVPVWLFNHLRPN